ncbi:MAG: protein phosphatase 2C domain-containing protein [Bacteroidales bacterium]|nr:protein phosphatase 2C domain-containing protein [Bacteroidales bacterium]MCF8333707.1 protein phosphatase 2C domain-containing protein [Bacteroidales bacterium]
MIKKLSIFGTTDVGQLRDHNEDNFVIAKDLTKKLWSYKRDEIVEISERGTVLVVADGMGGTNAGEVASDIAQQSVRQAFDQMEEMPAKDEALKSFLKKTIINAHEQIVSHQHTNLETVGMGTTLVIVWITPQKMYVGWSGDSRCYIYRGEDTLLPFTDDHSLVWDLVKNGKLTPEEARHHPESNVITQSLGEVSRPPEPAVKTAHYYKGDKILVCSDGLNGMLSDDQMRYYLAEDKPVADITRDLTNAANQAGGTDNITVLMASVVEGPEKPLKAETLPNEEVKVGTRTGALRKKIRSRNIMLGGISILVAALLAWQFLWSGDASATPENVVIRNKTADFIPGVRRNINLASLLTGRKFPVDSFAVDMDYKQQNGAGEISFVIDQNSPKEVTIILFTSDTTYKAYVAFMPRVLKDIPSEKQGRDSENKVDRKNGVKAIPDQKAQQRQQKINDNNKESGEENKSNDEKPVSEKEAPSPGKSNNPGKDIAGQRSEESSRPGLNRIDTVQKPDSLTSIHPKNK